MNVEIWGFNLLKKQALLLTGGNWYIASEEKDWRPTFLGPRTGGSPHPLLFEMEPVRQSYESFPDLLVLLKEAFSSRVASSVEVRLLLERSSLREPRQVRWEEGFLSFIPRYQRRLDALFARRGFSREESLSLILEAFNRVYRLGPLELEEVPVWLAQIALQLSRERLGERMGGPMPHGREQELEPGRLERALLELDRGMIRCLSLWAVSGRNEEEIAKLLRMDVGTVRIYLETAAARLGRSREQLKDPVLAQALARVYAR